MNDTGHECCINVCPDNRRHGLSFFLPAHSDDLQEWGGPPKTSTDYCGLSGNDRFTEALWVFSEAGGTTLILQRLSGIFIKYYNTLCTLNRIFLKAVAEIVNSHLSIHTDFPKRSINF